MKMDNRQSSDAPPTLAIVARLPRFKALLVESDGAVVGTRGRDVLRCAPPFEQFERVGRLPSSFPRHLSTVRILERLLRLEIYRMIRTPTGTDIAATREGILRRTAGSSQFEVAFCDVHVHRPLSLCTDAEGRIYFGEYFDNAKRDSVRIFGSEDDGRSWSEVYRFPPGSIRHVHGLIYDEFLNRIWVMTGDYGDEAKIALATPGFSHLDVICQGSQQTRACDGVCLPEGLVYATDTPLEQNHVYLLDPQTRQATPLAGVQNSVLFMGQACGGLLLSTIVEPSKVNTSPFVHVWFSADGRRWDEVYTAQRDFWSDRYLQFPTASFARGPRAHPFAFISLRGTRGDGECLVATLQ